MELPFALLLATNFFLDPIVAVMHQFLTALDGYVHNFGLSLVILAFLVKLVFWPLTTFQFKAMLKTQSLAPRIKQISAKYKNDPERRNAETMALYKEAGANPLAGCAPLIVQYPVLISLYYTILQDKESFATSKFLWIGTPVQGAIDGLVHFPILAASLANLDYLLLALYAISMYLSVRFTTPTPADEAAAQQQKIMAFVSPAMIGFLAIKFQWYSALLIYWLSFNLFGIAQQLYLIRKYHRNPAAAGPHPEDDAGGPPSIGPGGKGARSGKNGDLAVVVPNGTKAPGTPGTAARTNGNGSKRRRARR